MSSSTPPLRVGVAGLGVASTFALPAIAAHPRVRLAAAADARPAAREAFARQYGAPTYETVEALCESPHVDAVYVLTPNRWHARHAIMAAEGGKQVIADKPMALTLADCDAMIAAARRHGVRLLVGHSQGLDGPIVRMAALVASGELGRLIMVNTWFYSDWLYRPRGRDEIEAATDEGLVLRQGPPQVDIVRMLGGGLARTVRSATSRVDPTRPGEGSYVAYLEFAEGVPATLVHSAYAHFDSSELTHGIGLAGLPVEPDAFPRTRQRWAAFARPEDEWAYKDATRFGGPHAGGGGPPTPPRRHHACFGLTIASCECGDVRQSPDGLTVYGDEGRREIPLPPGSPAGRRYTATELDLMVDAWVDDAPLAAYDGQWGKATLEVCLAIQRAAAERREITLQHQTPYRPISLA
jgi:phthalate 4,5-cis-dihydrodiol dehydrogenase